MSETLRVGIVGFGWMGQVHARAFSRLRQSYPDAPLHPELVAVADNATDGRLQVAMNAYGFTDLHGDWRELLARDDIDMVSVTGPNFIHCEVGVAAAEAGKHLWIEKPAGRNAGETAEIAAAVRAAGVQSAVGFNYRNPPAVEAARQLVADGRLGTIEHVTVRLLSDYAADPRGALTWRYEQALAGSGVLGDLVSHAVDLGEYVAGPLAEVICDTATFVRQRRRPGGATTGHGAVGTGDLGPVENEDYVNALLRFAGGARGVLESSRVAVGEQNNYGIEVHGDRGALAWDFRRMGELRVALDQGYADASWSTRHVGPGAGEFGSFQPGSGIPMSYDDLKVIEARRLVESIATGRPHGPTIDDALRAARLVDALTESAAEGRWIKV